jgi:hypothetical protein
VSRPLARARGGERGQGRGEGGSGPRPERDRRRDRRSALSPFRRSATVPAAPLLCRWDLDKTYLRSEFDTLRQLWRTARERGEDKVVVPGVTELMKGLRAAADRHGRGVGMYFISASPPQIGQAIRDKLRLDGVPYDGIVFKDQLQLIRRGKFGKLREHVGFKLGELFRGRAGHDPATREVLFGDDWESDPLTYSLYADVVAGRLAPDSLGPLLQRVGVDPAVVPEILALAAPVAGLGGVERICINLERRTAPASFALYGPRLVPTFNYFQTAVVLAADGWLDAGDVGAVARGLAERSGYTPRRLENSLADLVRRRLLPAHVAHRLTTPLRQADLLPVLPRGAWLARLRARIATRRRGPSTPAARGALDFDAILARTRPARGAAVAQAEAR